VASKWQPNFVRHPEKAPVLDCVLSAHGVEFAAQWQLGGQKTCQDSDNGQKQRDDGQLQGEELLNGLRTKYLKYNSH